MHAGIGADIRPIFDDDVARECRGIGHDYTVADHAVVSNVRLGHDQTVVANLRQHPAGGAAMNRHELANFIALSDSRFRWFAFVFQVLRSEPDGDKRKDVGFGADKRAPIDDAM